MHTLTEDDATRAAAAIRLALALSLATEELARALEATYPEAFVMSIDERIALAELAARLSPQVPA